MEFSFTSLPCRQLFNRRRQGRFHMGENKSFLELPVWIKLVSDFNPFEKYYSKWIISPRRDENKKYLKPPPRKQFANECLESTLPETNSIFAPENRPKIPPKERFIFRPLTCRGHVGFRESPSQVFWLVVTTHLKNMLVKLDHFPK